MTEEIQLADPIREKFEHVLNCYTSLLRLHFPALLRRFEPGGDFDAGIVVICSDDGEPRSWCFARRPDGRSAVFAVRSDVASVLTPDPQVARDQSDLGAK